MIRRAFIVSTPGHAPADRAAWGPIDAARDYARDTLPGFDVIPGGQQAGPGLWRFEAIHYPRQVGALLWVREA